MRRRALRLERRRDRRVQRRASCARNIDVEDVAIQRMREANALARRQDPRARRRHNRVIDIRITDRRRGRDDASLRVDPRHGRRLQHRARRRVERLEALLQDRARGGERRRRVDARVLVHA